MFPLPPDGVDGGCRYGDDVGPYLSPAGLGQAEREQFETHLPDCASCQTNLDRFGHVPDLLASLRPEDWEVIVEDLLAGQTLTPAAGSIPPEETVAFQLDHETGLTPPRRQRHTPGRGGPPKPPAPGRAPG